MGNIKLNWSDVIREFEQASMMQKTQVFFEIETIFHSALKSQIKKSKTTILESQCDYSYATGVQNFLTQRVEMEKYIASHTLSFKERRQWLEDNLNIKLIEKSSAIT